ncbi:Actin-related protein 2/3 complex subunit 4 [Diplonema papillatum]|nr:Actin-related protein 2/3 complex subunit 4 [Diplonema papillatum]
MTSAGVVAQQPYINCIKRTLDAALCLMNFPSQVVERHNKPEVEAKSSPGLLLNPVVIAREDGAEQVLIESSVNSVRLSIKIRKIDALDKQITLSFMNFLERRAEYYYILRRKPVFHDGTQYDLSLLITNEHTDTMHKERLIDWVVAFMQDISKELSDIKIHVGVRARVVAKEYFENFIR